MPRPIRRPSSPLIDERRTNSFQPTPPTPQNPSVQILLDNRIRIDRSMLEPMVELALREAFTHPNPDWDRQSRFIVSKPWLAHSLPPKTVETWQVESGVGNHYSTLTLPRGGMKRVRDVFAEHAIPVEIIDRREELGVDVWQDNHKRSVIERYRLAIVSSITLFDFQEQMVEKSIEHETCVLRAPTGSGKTLAAFAIAARIQLPTLILVPTDLIFTQWIERATSEMGIPRQDVGVIRGKVARVRMLTIATVQTFSKVASAYAYTFGTVIFDEVQKAAANTFYSAVDPLAAKYRIGISAEERRKDKKEFMIYDAFGEVAIDVKRKDLIAKKVIHETQIVMVPTQFEADWYTKLTPLERGGNEPFRYLLEEMQANDARNKLASDLALDSMKAGYPSIVFAHRVEHCFKLLADIATNDPRVGVCVGDRPVEKKASIEGMKDGTKLCAVGTYQSIGTGVDLPSVSRGVCVTPIHTNRPFFGQVRGRICRVDRKEGAVKDDSLIYYLWDVKVHGPIPLRNLLSWTNGNVTVLVNGKHIDGSEYLNNLEDELEDRTEQGIDVFKVGV